jgi:hypothetical protein
MTDDENPLLIKRQLLASKRPRPRPWFVDTNDI